jgi:hypothetical protein
MIRIFLRVEEVINRVIGHAASAFLVVAALAAFYQVITRFIFEQPSTWSEALTRTCLIWMVFLGITIAFRHGALVAIDLAYRSVAGRWQTLLQSFITLGSITLLAGRDTVVRHPDDMAGEVPDAGRAGSADRLGLRRPAGRSLLQPARRHRPLLRPPHGRT